MSTGEETYGLDRGGEPQLRRRWRADPCRAALLLVHGMAEHSGRYEHVGRSLSDRGVDVLSFDLRGHGRSGGRRGHVEDFDHFLDDVQDLLAERRGLGVPVVLMGHSMGGLISAAYAVSDRPQPDLLVLSAPALAADIPAWQRVAATALSRLVPTLSLPNDFDGELLTRDPEVGAAYRDDPLRVRKATTRLGNEIFKAMEATASAAPSSLSVPTYVLHGAADQLVPPQASEPLATHPQVTRKVYDALRHECLNEPERDEVLVDLHDWLDARLDERA
ncbi:MAG: alpha/beta hydrolase [Acidimicrobiales bacterium]